jgi:hypothetical protein
LSGHVPLFNGEAAAQPKASLSAVAEWLSDNIIDEPELAGALIPFVPVLVLWTLLFWPHARLPSTGTKAGARGCCWVPADSVLGSPPKGGRRAELPPAGVVQGAGSTAHACLACPAILPRTSPHQILSAGIDA